MNAIKIILTGLAILIVITAIAVYAWLNYLLPSYSGKIPAKEIRDSVTVYFDEYAIPHIYAQSQEDAWFVLGYVHAQERLFQMELLRRVGGGRLSEIFGKELIKIDKLFRTIGIGEVAKVSAKKFLSENKSPYQKLAFAYMDGINKYIEEGKTPIEFTMLGIDKEKFTPEDFYLISGYMGFSFAEAFRVDPILSKIKEKLGANYLQDLNCSVDTSAIKIPVHPNDSIQKLASAISEAISSILEKNPVPVFIGSNGWVVAPQKSKSGKVLFANDTHITFSQPAVWYEAHIETPGYSLYGNFLAGFPFPLVGHSRHHAWGLTMFENDDINLYREKENPLNKNQYFYKSNPENYIVRNETIKVKNAPDENHKIKTTIHGPVINSLIDQLDSAEQNPVSVWWAYNHYDATTIEAAYRMCHANSVQEMHHAVSLINSPGLNVMYGDSTGNIAWWAAARLQKFPAHVNTKFILDGASGNDEAEAEIPFRQNPQSINPPEGFVYSANNQPDSVNGIYFPGYYTPNDRASRILDYLNVTDKIDLAYLQQMQNDNLSLQKKNLAHHFAALLNKNKIVSKTSVASEALRKLSEWDGGHNLEQAAPAIFYTFLSFLLKNTMADELGDKDYNVFINSHAMKTSYDKLLFNVNSVWYDDIATAEKKESCVDIAAISFSQTISRLEKRLGQEVKTWTWNKVHTLEINHAIGRKKPFDKIFNSRQLAVPGGNETVNNLGFSLDTSASFNVAFGSAMRISIDLIDIENSQSILPGGQSGFFFSNHYDDQLNDYCIGKSRKQMMNANEISAKSKNRLVFFPYR